MNNFEILKEIGSGTFGIVCMVKHKLDKQIYAIKRIKIIGKYLILKNYLPYSLTYN